MPITCLVNALLVLPESAGGPRLAPMRFDERRIISLDQPPKRGDVVIDLPGYAAYPGLINAHDHLEFNHYPRLKLKERYAHGDVWWSEITSHLGEPPMQALQALPPKERQRVGLIKNLRAGVTTVAHHGPYPQLATGIGPRLLNRYGWAYSLGMAKAEDIQRAHQQAPKEGPFFIHLAEGTEEAAAEEFARLEALACLDAKTVLIHGVALTEADREKAINAGVGLVWCPSSNFHVLGKTGDVKSFAQASKLALGSESRLSGVGDLLDELRAAHSLNQLTAAQLFRAVTIDAAAMLRLPDRGALTAGKLPDFFLLPNEGGDPFEALMDLRPEYITGLYVAGKRVLFPEGLPAKLW
jgi:cytosine/adenosine deaminase-related metal-dependent hydrolase